MNKYELLIILSAEIDDTQKEALLEKVQGLLTARGAVNFTVDKWGIKRYAYSINFKNEGYYALINFEAPGSAISEVEKQLNITENVVRSIFVRK